MSMVGSFPGLFANKNKQTTRAPSNPLDKTTVISIFPKDIIETKWTLQPGVFHLLPGTFEKPSCLVVGPSSWWKDIDENQPLLEIPQSSILIAESIVNDYCNGLLGCNMGDSMPGLSYIPGEWTPDIIKKDHLPLLLKMQQQQKNWFLELVKVADIDWARTNGNPLSISQDAKLACRELNIQNKDWLKNYQTAELVRCVACGSLRNPAYPICQTCKAVADPVRAKELNLSFVQ